MQRADVEYDIEQLNSIFEFAKQTKSIVSGMASVVDATDYWYMGRGMWKYDIKRLLTYSSNETEIESNEDIAEVRSMSSSLIQE